MKCPYCHDDLSEIELITCARCNASHHSECWLECGSCASCRSPRIGVAQPAIRLSVRRATVAGACLAVAIDMPVALVYDIGLVVKDLFAQILWMGKESFLIGVECCLLGFQVITSVVCKLWTKLYGTLKKSGEPTLKT